MLDNKIENIWGLTDTGSPINLIKISSLKGIVQIMDLEQNKNGIAYKYKWGINGSQINTLGQCELEIILDILPEEKFLVYIF